MLTSIAAVLDSGRWSDGPATLELERQWASAAGPVYHSVATSSAGTALTMISRLLRPRSTVLVPAVSYLADVSCLLAGGVRVHVVDVQPDTGQMSAEAVGEAHAKLRAEGADVSAVLALPLGGWITPDLAQIDEFCRSEHLFLMVDGAHAHGATYHGTPLSWFGDAVVYSFYPTKMVAASEGGIIITRHEGLATSLRHMRNYGCQVPNEPEMLGENYRMAEVSAAMAVVQTDSLVQRQALRGAVAREYDAALPPGYLPLRVDNSQPSWYKYVVVCTDADARNLLLSRLQSAGVSPSGYVFPVPVVYHRCFDSVLAPVAVPGAHAWCTRHVCLPLYDGILPREVEQVLSALSP